MPCDFWGFVVMRSVTGNCKEFGSDELDEVVLELVCDILKLDDINKDCCGIWSAIDAVERLGYLSTSDQAEVLRSPGVIRRLASFEMGFDVLKFMRDFPPESQRDIFLIQSSLSGLVSAGYGFEVFTMIDELPANLRVDVFTKGPALRELIPADSARVVDTVRGELPLVREKILTSPGFISDLALFKPKAAMDFVCSQRLEIQGDILCLDRVVERLMIYTPFALAECIVTQPPEMRAKIYAADGALFGFKEAGLLSSALDDIADMDASLQKIVLCGGRAITAMGNEFALAFVKNQPQENLKDILLTDGAFPVLARTRHGWDAIDLLKRMTLEDRGMVLLKEGVGVELSA